MGRKSDDLGSERAYQAALKVAPNYRQRLIDAVLLAQRRAARSSSTVQELLSGGDVIGLASDMRIKCSYLVLRRGGILGYMWHLIDECSTNELAKRIFRDIRATAARLDAMTPNNELERSQLPSLALRARLARRSTGR